MDKNSDRILFKKSELSADGDIPAVFKIEGGNFTPFDIIGDVSFDEEGKAVLANGLLDGRGKQINQQGYLVDGEGNIVDRMGKVKITKAQLTSEGEIPPLYTYEGKKFKIKDVIGDFDREEFGGQSDIKIFKTTEPDPDNPEVH